MKDYLTKLVTVGIIFIVTTFISGSTAIAEEITITDNGSGSSNEVTINSTEQTTVTQNNTSETNTTVDTTANSGGNSADQNTGGQTNIQTGEVTNSVEIQNQANTSTVTQDCCPTNAAPSSVTITGNGANSQNSASLNGSVTTVANINNNAKISNVVNGKANSGGNTANFNNGDVSIRTGNVSVTEKILNKNINNAKVSLASSNGHLVDIKIAGNGVGSKNNAQSLQNQLQLINVINNASISNISNWFANSGNNIASMNVGNVIVITGNVAIDSLIANVGINTSEVTVTCCDNGSNPTPTPSTTPTPTTPPSGGENPPGNNGGGGNGGGGNGGSSSGSSSGSTSTGQVLGAVLPQTGNLALWQVTLISLLLLSLGLYLRFNEDKKKPTKKRVSKKTAKALELPNYRPSFNYALAQFSLV